MKNKFVPKNDLSKLTEEEKRQYYEDVCNHFDIPPELNLLYYGWFDSGDGAKSYVLYGSKGFADRMRAKLEIETDSLEETFTDKIVMFKCKGHDKTGRHEIAVGAESLVGLSGRKLGDAVAKSQTKATRRMTLQFVGAGILDESEKGEGGVSKDVTVSEVPLSVLAQPTVEVNNKAFAAPQEFTSNMTQTGFGFTAAPVFIQTGSLSDIIKPEFEFTPGGPKKRGRPPGPRKQKPTELEMLGDQIQEEMKPKFKVTLPIVAEPIEPFPLPIETVSTADETKAFKQWLFNYTANILPRDGGMVGAAGIGGPRMKVQAFARIMFPGKELEHLNREEQEKFKHYFDSAVKQDVNGPGTGVKGLVAIINETIGAKT